MLEQRARRVTLNIYGRKDQSRMVDDVVYLYAMPDRPVRVVAVEPLTGGRTTQAFFSTCVEASAEKVLTWYAMRWSIETMFHDSKGQLGFEEPQGWTKRAVQRTAPTAMLRGKNIVSTKSRMRASKGKETNGYVKGDKQSFVHGFLPKLGRRAVNRPRLVFGLLVVFPSRAREEAVLIDPNVSVCRTTRPAPPRARWSFVPRCLQVNTPMEQSCRCEFVTMSVDCIPPRRGARV